MPQLIQIPLFLFIIVPDICSLIGDYYSIKGIKNKIEYNEKLRGFRKANLRKETESFRRLGQQEKELDCINKILSIDSADIESLSNKMSCPESLGQTKEAQRVEKEFKNTKKNGPLARFRRAIAIAFDFESKPS